MVYKVNYDSLDAMCSNITRQASDWNTEIETVSTASQKLIQSSNMAGNGADAIREYMTNVHQLLQGLICEALSLHASNVVLYFDDYQVSVDSALHTRIDSDELNRLREELENTKNRAIDIDDELAYQLGRISDIFSVNYRDVYGVAQSHQTALDRIKKLDESVCTLETQHQSKDFVCTGNLITSLTALINECLSIQRGGQASFTVEQLAISKAFQAVYAAHLSASDDLAEKSTLLQSAIERQNERELQLQKEIEERIETVKWQKLIVSAVVVVGSALLIAAVPVSGPLVVGLVSGASSAIMGATNEAMDLYIEDGDISGDDLKQVGIEAGKGFAVGFATGVVGGVVGKTVSGLTEGIPALQSANATINTATHVAIGSASDIVTGIATRTTSEVIDQVTDDQEGINLLEIGKEAFDGGEIIKDGVIGGIGGYYDGHKVDYSKSMHSDYEQGTLKDMYAKGELEYSVDPELDGVEYVSSDDLTYDMKPKSDPKFVEDYIIKKKNDGLSSTERITIDNLFSPDDYSNSKHEMSVRMRKIMEMGEKIIDKAKVETNVKLSGGSGALGGAILGSR